MIFSQDHGENIHKKGETGGSESKAATAAIHRLKSNMRFVSLLVETASETPLYGKASVQALLLAWL